MVKETEKEQLVRQGKNSKRTWCPESHLKDVQKG